MSDVLHAQVSRMLASARSRRDDAELLQRHVGSSDSGYLLNLLAFEVLLKALVLAETGKPSTSQ